MVHSLWLRTTVNMPPFLSSCKILNLQNEQHWCQYKMQDYGQARFWTCLLPLSSVAFSCQATVHCVSSVTDLIAFLWSHGLLFVLDLLLTTSHLLSGSMRKRSSWRTADHLTQWQRGIISPRFFLQLWNNLPPLRAAPVLTPSSGVLSASRLPYEKMKDSHFSQILLVLNSFR